MEPEHDAKEEYRKQLTDALPFLVADNYVRDALLDDLPAYLHACDELAQSVRFFVRGYGGRDADEDRVLVRLVNHASNDLLELIGASLHGSGRSMLRSARSLFEVAVGCQDIPGSADLSDRYLLHQEANQGLLLELDRLAEFYSDTPKSIEHHRRKSARKATRVRAEGIDRWGSAWLSNWAGKTLRQRAEAVGLLHDYDTFYRFASQPTHASAGGTYGTHRPIDGYSVVRYGPALAACPVALIYGLAYFRIVLDHIGLRPATNPTHQALDALWGLVSDYGDLVHALDEAMWPEEGFIPGGVTVARITPWSTSWLIHDLVLGKVIAADEPAEISGRQRKWLAQNIEEVRSIPISDFREPLTIAFVNVRTTPKAGAQWLDETDRLPRKPFFQDPDLIPRSEPLPDLE